VHLASLVSTCGEPHCTWRSYIDTLITELVTQVSLSHWFIAHMIAVYLICNVITVYLMQDKTQGHDQEIDIFPSEEIKQAASWL